MVDCGRLNTVIVNPAFDDLMDKFGPLGSSHRLLGGTEFNFDRFPRIGEDVLG
jgi:hypothetical protein